MRVAGQRYTYPVHHGDTLWGISAAWLGNPHRWTDIYQLNRDHYDRHGRMRHGAHIEPGWVLVLPQDATPPHGTPTTQPHTATPPPPAAAVPAPRPSPPSQVSAAPADPTPITSVSAPPTGPVAAPLPAPAGIASAASRTPTASPSPSRSPRAQPRGIELPGGSWVDLGLATAISAAASMVWIQRRRRYIPRPPSPTLRLDDPDLAPLPPVVNIIRRGLRNPDPDDDDPFDILPGTDLDEDATDEPDEGGKDDADVQPFGFAEQPPTPVVPALASPLLQVWPPAGLGLVGPGAHAAGRGLLAAALAAGSVDDVDTRTHVVIPTATLTTLLGTTAIAVPQTPRLRVTRGLDDALKILETQALHRTRMLDAYEVETVAALRDDDPLAEPLPPVLLIADADIGHERARIAALLAQGERLDIRGVLLGAWPDGDTVTVAADGTTTGQMLRTGRHSADAVRLAVLTPAQTTDLLATLAQSYTPTPQPANPTQAATEPTNCNSASPTHNDEKPPPPQVEGIAATASPPAGPVNDRAGVAVDDPATTADQPASEHGDGDKAIAQFDTLCRDVEEGDDGADGRRSGHAEVVLLGPLRVVNADPNLKVRPQAWELLTYLAVKGGTATKEAILDDMMPSASARKAPHRLDTYVYNLRQMLHHAGGHAQYVQHPLRQLTYTLNPQAVSIDLWRMREAIAAAQAATDPTARIAAWRVAVDAYTGPLAEGKDYEWIEPYREATRQQAIDAHLALADALADQPTQALTVLEAAIRHDPYAEPLYQKTMRTHAQLANIEGIRGLRRALSQRLTDIDADISDDTIALAEHLITQIQHPRPPATGRRDDA